MNDAKAGDRFILPANKKDAKLELQLIYTSSKKKRTISSTHRDRRKIIYGEDTVISTITQDLVHMLASESNDCSEFKSICKHCLCVMSVSFVHKLALSSFFSGFIGAAVCQINC